MPKSKHRRKAVKRPCQLTWQCSQFWEAEQWTKREQHTG